MGVIFALEFWGAEYLSMGEHRELRDLIHIKLLIGLMKTKIFQIYFEKAYFILELNLLESKVLKCCLQVN